MKRIASSLPEKLVRVNASAMQKPLSKKHVEQLRKLAAMPDSEIDFGDAPDTAGGIFEPVKLPVAICIDSDILAWLRIKPSYQTRINQILRSAMIAERRNAVAKRSGLNRKSG